MKKIHSDSIQQLVEESSIIPISLPSSPVCNLVFKGSEQELKIVSYW